MESDLREFLEMLYQATARIERHYFQLPIAGEEDPVYRERVYCYELYHRIRQVIPPDYPSVLNGEVDKAGHPLIRDEIGSAKPDFVVHVPGVMHRNLAVVEVKPITAHDDDIRDDLRKLRLFRERAYYLGAVYLVYGNAKGGVGRFKDLLRLERRPPVLLWHSDPGSPAYPISQS